MNNTIKILQKEGIEFEIIKNDRKIHSAKDGADYFGIRIGQTAPILIIHTDKGFHSIIISGSQYKLDFTEFQNKFGFSNVRMASKSEVEAVTGYQTGNIPMLGLPLPCIVDKQLFNYDFVYGGTGIENYTLKVNPDGIIKANNVIGVF